LTKIASKLEDFRYDDFRERERESTLEGESSDEARIEARKLTKEERKLKRRAKEEKAKEKEGGDEGAPTPYIEIERERQNKKIGEGNEEGGWWHWQTRATEEREKTKGAYWESTK